MSSHSTSPNTEPTSLLSTQAPVWSVNWADEIWQILKTSNFPGGGESGLWERLVQPMSIAVSGEQFGVTEPALIWHLGETTFSHSPNRNYSGSYDALIGQYANSIGIGLENLKSDGNYDVLIGQNTNNQGLLPDLTAQSSDLSLDFDILPGESGSMSVVLTNSGRSKAEGPVKFDFFAALLDEVDSTTFKVGELSLDNLLLNPNETTTLAAQIELPNELEQGLYMLFLEIDTDNTITESNEDNNRVLVSRRGSDTE